MDLYLYFIFILCMLGSIFFIKGKNSEYIDKENSTAVKGIFILSIFFSHSIGYVSYMNRFSMLMYAFIYILGQLVVAMFLFYSGYGIYESYKKKKDNYLKTFPKKRILKTLINFDLVIILYFILYIIINKNFSVEKTLLSLIGWDSLGNSNWYIFDILLLYVVAYISLTIVKNKKISIILSWLLSIGLILFLKNFKEIWWYNTILCFPFGMTYSYYKEKINMFLFSNRFTNIKYIFSCIFILILICIFNECSKMTVFFYELESILFCILVILLTLKVQLNNKILKWFGDNLFYIYILQRLPMIILSTYFALNSYVFFIISFVSTIVLTFIVKYTFNTFIFFNKRNV